MNEELEKPVVEAPEVEDRSDKLSNREAMERAISEKREPSTAGDAPESKADATPTQKEVKAAVNADPEPPSEFNTEEQKAWRQKDISGIQKAYTRLNTSRVQELSRAQTSERQHKERAEKEANEAKTWRELGKMAAPYIEARGAEGVTPQQAMMEALALIQEFKKGDPTTVKAELKKIGIDLDVAPGTKVEKQDNSQLTTLQQRLERLEAEKEEEKFQKTADTFGGIFDKLTSLKTRTGDSVFPDLLDTSEKGIQFAKELGSLTQDERFRAGVLRRFPEADLTILVREAYKYLGGKVSGEPVTVSTSNQKHIEKSRRAAASSPQGGTMRSRSDSSSLIGKLSNKAALLKAFEESREH